ncbi:MAG: beta-lactamase family protein [Parvibaculum sp.]|uniref:serine hydrolase domain-containing protein n=1 Tax=Parvibaculum sp. TaxID=2024848 RepID=UPI0025EB6FBF|nr:serine hydrolase [Parvibaculum sp.]MCE9649620.1 beta-lactamase family protein [Parvibaculum sp.]
MSATVLPPLPQQPKGTPWPTKEWPRGDMPGEADGKRLAALLDHAFAKDAPADLGETHATVIVKDGKLILERYWTGFGPDVTCPSWSKAKSITQALVGILAGEGKLDIHAPAAVPEWKGVDDKRAAITLDQLLRMSSGLAFREDYVEAGVSDVIEMLFGKGKDDVGHFAASFPLEHKPDTFWSYSSGTTNIISRIVKDAAGVSGDSYEAFMRERLLDRIGMTSALPKFDAAGTFIGSSFCYATPRDFARFGLLYLRDGVWEGQRILPEGWVDYARTPTWQQPTDSGPYGAQWWLGVGGPGSFSANGYEGQFTVCCPDIDLVIVRHGKTPAAQSDNVKAWLKGIADCFRG